MYDINKPATNILHPTDLSDCGETAFAHALGIAILNQANLTILHVIRDREDVVPWQQFPSVRRTLRRWGYLEDDAERADVFRKLGISVEKRIEADTDAGSAIVDFARTYPPDLIVMGTTESRILPEWLSPSTSSKVSAETDVPMLLVPCGVKTCISMDDGSSTLNNAVVVLDQSKASEALLNRVAAVAQKIGNENLTVYLAYNADNSEAASLSPFQDSRANWIPVELDVRSPDKLEQFARDKDAELLAVVHGKSRSFWDFLHGSFTSQLMGSSPCPIFAIADG